MNKYSKFLTLFLALTFIMVFTGISQEKVEKTVVCPVSGETMKKSEAKVTYDYEGKTYYFCCEKCKKEFIENPEKYTKKKSEKKEIYSCSMHPDVKSDKSGKCPKCGMKLKKKMMTQKKHMHMDVKEKQCCSMMELMSCKDIEMSVEKLENGVVVKISSENEEYVKKIQNLALHMKDMQKKTCEKKDKKEEEKK